MASSSGLSDWKDVTANFSSGNQMFSTASTVLGKVMDRFAEEEKAQQAADLKREQMAQDALYKNLNYQAKLQELGIRSMTREETARHNQMMEEIGMFNAKTNAAKAEWSNMKNRLEVLEKMGELGASQAQGEVDSVYQIVKRQYDNALKAGANPAAPFLLEVKASLEQYEKGGKNRGAALLSMSKELNKRQIDAADKQDAEKKKKIESIVDSKLFDDMPDDERIKAKRAVMGLIQKPINLDNNTGIGYKTINGENGVLTYGDLLSKGDFEAVIKNHVVRDGIIPWMQTIGKKGSKTYSGITTDQLEKKIRESGAVNSAAIEQTLFGFNKRAVEIYNH